MFAFKVKFRLLHRECKALHNAPLSFQPLCLPYPSALPFGTSFPPLPSCLHRGCLFREFSPSICPLPPLTLHILAPLTLLFSTQSPLTLLQPHWPLFISWKIFSFSHLKPLCLLFSMTGIFSLLLFCFGLKAILMTNSWIHTIFIIHILFKEKQHTYTRVLTNHQSFTLNSETSSLIPAPFLLLLR